MSDPTSAQSTPSLPNPQPIQQQEQQQPESKEKEEQIQQIAIPLAEGHRELVHLPRVTIRYCTQCKWLLRAAYFAQELLSTFSTTLGEVSLVPATGGVFTVSILHESNVDFTTAETVLWDRKAEGGFPGGADTTGKTDMNVMPTQTQAQNGSSPPVTAITDVCKDCE
ncbi:hypothetical protein RJZ90_005108 [Blastomyces dermatitidis]